MNNHEPLSRCALLLGAGLLLALGCTTSRAQLAWEAGRRAEAKGQRARALRLYARAGGLRDHLVGAKLDHIRLLAAVPDSRPAAQAELDALLAKRGGEIEVATFGAAWALRAGRAKRAKERLAAARQAALARTRCDAVLQAFLRVSLAAELGLGRHAGAERARDLLVRRCGAEAVPPSHGALVAFNRGDPAGARRELGRLPAADTSAPLLRAALALEAGRARRAAAILGGLQGEELGPLVWVLRGQAALGMGKPEAALADGRRALRLRPGYEPAEQLMGVARLRQGDARAARDLLAGIAARGGEGVHWTVLFDLGIAEVRLGALEAAARRFKHAADRCGGCAPARNNAAALDELLR